MLNKRFKIAKCKTSLKLATSRIKLMRNKKGVQINGMKKELAQLLESGQDRTARIRVEHVIREEKMMAAYDLIEIYCELIVARLPIIESQKTCPIDLKEAVTSVIFAAPRCSDIPELVDAKKNFTAKYGKEFVSAAIELRPDCGVSRMLVEKLSAVAPDLQTKIKVLSAVAKEHSINWDSTSFEEKESKPPDDLLNGPTYFEKASTISVDSPKTQTSNAQNVQSNEQSPNEHFDFSQQNKRFTVDAQNVTAADTAGDQKLFASASYNDMRPSGLGSGTVNTSQSFHSNNNNSSFGREKWNMGFKDATSAAQAAAESAERASIAARAAAELSSQARITQQYSTESYISEQKPQVSSGYTREHNLRDPYKNTSFNDRKPKMQNQQMNPTEIDSSPEATQKPSGLRSRNDSIKENSVNYFETYETSSKKESRGRFTSWDHEGSSASANVDSYGEGVIKKQPVITPSRTHSATIRNEHDDLTFNRQTAGQRGDVDHKNLLRETTKYDGVRSDDESDSDEGPRFDTGFEYDEGEAKSFFPSPDREPFCPPEETHISIVSPKKNTSDTTELHSAKSFDHSMKFDLSDGPDYETEAEIRESSIGRTNKLTSRVDPRTNKLTSPVDPTYIESPPKVNPIKTRIELNDLVETDSFFHKKSDDFDTGKDLNFGTLTGGLRNKGGLKYPPYMKTAVKESPVKSDQASKSSSFNSRASRMGDEKPSVSISSFESDSDDYSETYQAQKSFKTRSQFAAPDNFFTNDETESEKQASSVSKQTGQAHLGSGLSRRTKVQVEPAGKAVFSTPLPSENLSKNPVTKHAGLDTMTTSAEQKASTRPHIMKSTTEPGPDPTRFDQHPFRRKPDPKISEPPPDSTKKTVEPRKTEAPVTLNLNSETKLAADVKKPSHVHPKLPDYDLLVARIHALSKMNHQ